ncbi:HAMP domain-containing sensor histidine kinase [Oceanirhabdus seepicola]|uniref:histidine kinase n=1 Tax=Oceanirhabdus seepicola TaxID=2828781 RepID=A0A9J6P1J6_9CLOT|nr:HAMP domain-containing sensor histidine kinase [Oceanirhabdus seepicola]MCM1989368.1 HAMP domain-containing histidine kinase [Oceanirhabdus seepicola]
MNNIKKIKSRYFYGISVKVFLLTKIAICIFLLLSLYPQLTTMNISGNKINVISIVAIISILFFSYYYNKILAKPLIEINEAVSKIVQLDFSVKCNISSNDELGELSNNLNLVSSKLNRTIMSLETEIEEKKELLKIHRDLTDNLAHEIKTPLGTVKAYAEAIEDDITPEKQSEYINTIIEETDKLNNLIVELLDLSSIETRAVEVNYQSFDIIRLIEEIAGRILIDSANKDFNVECDFEKEPIFITGDREKLAKAISNLILNAYKYVTDNGLIKLSVKQEKNKVKVSIFNTSEPIPEDKIQYIWQRFYRLDSSRNKKTGGNGIGLATASEIFKLHDFIYGVKNEGSGVVFYFEIYGKFK